jgi:hypothetical protein
LKYARSMGLQETMPTNRNPVGVVDAIRFFPRVAPKLATLG